MHQKKQIEKIFKNDRVTGNTVKIFEKYNFDNLSFFHHLQIKFSILKAVIVFYNIS